MASAAGVFIKRGSSIFIARSEGWVRVGIMRFGLSVGAALFLSILPSSADDTNLVREVRELREQNQLLQQQLQQQGGLIQALTEKVDGLKAAHADDAGGSPEAAATPTKGGFNLGRVNLSGEGGMAFFNTGEEGFAPHSEFRVDEMRLFVEAPLGEEVYFYGGVDLATRENVNLSLYLDELYLDAQDLSRVWGHDGQLNLRVGRLNIPFGEEYLSRYVIDDPLISHSLSDLWGTDPGVELYGTLGRFCYVLAVQNGSGANGVQDFDGDKSVTARLGYDPARWLHLSVSGMRTGNLNVQQDSLSALWFGNGFFRSLGSPSTTTFHADLVEGDIKLRWPGGSVNAFGGYARYGDNDPAADNDRDIYYYSVEGVQHLTRKMYAAARFSQIMADRGFPIVGYGNFGDYFFDGLTTELWRLSLGMGYRFNNQILLKAEYSFERGRESDGGARDREDFLGTEIAFKF